MTKGLKILGASTTDKYHEVILELTPAFNSTFFKKENRSESSTRKTGKTEAMNKRNRRERRTKMVDI